MVPERALRSSDWSSMVIGVSGVRELVGRERDELAAEVWRLARATRPARVVRGFELARSSVKGNASSLIDESRCSEIVLAERVLLAEADESAPLPVNGSSGTMTKLLDAARTRPGLAGRRHRCDSRGCAIRRA